jgi:hypothetical protein
VGAPRLDAVRQWRDRLRASDPTPLRSPLSPEGVRAALDASLDALTDQALAEATSIPGEPFATAAMAVARTVLTAPIEWCAVLLARGTRVALKHPRGQPGLTPLLVEVARELDLPLTATEDRAALQGAELVIAMGSDESVARIGVETGAVRKLLFGARFSVAWVLDHDAMRAVARDAALHDGRGCFSPVAVATPLPLHEAVDSLAEAMIEAERAIPRGSVDRYEAARVRERAAIARLTGELAEGPAWQVHGLPAERFAPGALPRVLGLYRVDDRPALEAWLAPWRLAVSTVGTDDPELALDRVRVVPVGEMQRPPLIRLHDGVDWVRETLRYRSTSRP